MTQQALPGTNYDERKPELSQWYTPPELAKRIVEFADDSAGFSPEYVLEPSAGRGALCSAIMDRWPHVMLTAVDIDQENARELRRKLGSWAHVAAGNFLEIEPTDFGHDFDLVVMNPPFEGWQAESHIMHALNFAGRVVAHCPLTTLAGVDRRVCLWSRVELDRLAICATRPRYGGPVKGSGATDMCTISIRKSGGLHAPAYTTQIEIWP